MGNNASAPERAGAVAVVSPHAAPHANAAAGKCGATQTEQSAVHVPSFARADSADPELHLLEKVNSLQQQLALVNANPLLGLPEAAELLAESLEVDLVAIYVVPKGDPTSSALIAAHGAGVPALRRCPVVRPKGPGPDQRRLGAPRALHVADARAPGAGPEPSELWAGDPALRSFVQVPIGTPSAPLGVLLVAKSTPSAFGDPWWNVGLQLACASLLPHVRQQQVGRMARLLSRLDCLEDPFQLVHVLLTSSSDFLLKASTLRASARLALLLPRGAPEALLLETPAPPQAASCSGAALHGSLGPPDAPLGAGGGGGADGRGEEELVASLMRISNTLLGAAVAQRQARFVADVGAYMQTSARPAKDVFTRGSRLVSSVVVVPLINGEEAPLGGLYFALDSPCEFMNISDTLLGFIHGVTPLLHKKLAGRAEEMTSLVQSAQSALRSSGTTATSGLSMSASCDALNLGAALNLGPANAADGSAVSGCSGSRPGSDAGAAASCASPAPSGRTPLMGCGQRLNTEAMMQVLQQDLRSKSLRSRSCGGSRGAEIAVGECLGHGAWGAVYKGSWHRTPVAVKVMPSRNDESQAMQDAVEMAVLSSVQHPNIVTVYSCLTDMVEAGDCGSISRSVSMSGELRTYYRHLMPDEDAHGDLDTYSIIVMEPCDRGSLRGAIDAGMLHQALPSGAVGVRLVPAVELLVDVAYALQHLHSLQLVHGDLKVDNVLLKTDRARPLGVTPKLADFGLTRILNDTPTSVGPIAARPAAHIAPELLAPGGRVTTAIDAYSFGVLMWEVYTGKRALGSVATDELPRRVREEGLRPRFPSSAPAAFAQLAQSCWAADPADRPSLAQIAAGLERFAEQLSRPCV